MPVARSILPPPTNQPAHLLTVIVSVRMASSQKQCRGPDLKMFLCHHRPTLPSSARIKGHLCCGLCHNRNGTSSTSAYGQHSNTAPPSSSSTPARQPRTSTSSTAAQQHSSTAAAIKSHALCAGEYARHQWGRINTAATAFRLLSPEFTTHERVGCVLRNSKSRAHARAAGTNRRTDD